MVPKAEPSSDGEELLEEEPGSEIAGHDSQEDSADADSSDEEDEESLS